MRILQIFVRKQDGQKTVSDKGEEKSLPLFVVIGLAPEDGHCAIDLLNEEEADHLMRERHLRERDLAVGPIVDFGRKAVRTAYYEIHILPCRHPFLQIVGKLYGAVFFSVLVEQNNERSGAYSFEDKVAFLRFLLVLSEIFCVLEFGNHLQLKGKVVREALLIIVDERNDM